MKHREEVSLRSAAPPIVARAEAVRRELERADQDFAETVARVTAHLCALFAPICWTGLYVANRDRVFRRIGGYGQGDRLSQLSDRAIMRGFRDLGRPVVLPAFARDGGCMASAPLITDGSITGLLVLEGAPGAPAFTRDDLAALVTLAECLATCRRRKKTTPAAKPPAEPAEENAPGENEAPASDGRLAYDLLRARDIQQRLLPQLPRFIECERAGLQVAAQYRPAFEVGGDFYDVCWPEPTRFMAIIGDVSGKGFPAALIMSRVMAQFRVLCESGQGPSQVLAAMNQMLLDRELDDAFVTCACIQLDMASQELIVANAGHVPPLIRRTIEDIAILDRSVGPPLGILEGEQYPQEELHLDPQDVLVLMTDGITEALDRIPEPTPASRLIATVETGAQNIYDLASEIVAAVDRYGNGSRDDLAVMAVQIGKIPSAVAV